MNDLNQSSGSPAAKTGMILAVILILAAGLIVRWAYGQADPPNYFCMGTSTGDEGWQHEARNKALWGDWHVPNDQWRTMLVTTPANVLTYLSLQAFGVSTSSLRLMPRLLGMLTVVLLGWTAWKMWGRTAGLASMLASALALPLVAYSRVALIEGFLMPAEALFMLLVLLQLRGRRLGFPIGLTAVLCFSIKASAVLFLLPGGAAIAVALVADKLRGLSWIAATKRSGIGGMILGAVVGGAAFWMLVVRGNPSEWWFINFTHFGVQRVSLGVRTVLQNIAKIPTHSDGVLVSIAPLMFLAAIEALRAMAEFARGFRKEGAGKVASAINPEMFLTVMLLVTIPLLVVYGGGGVAGRRTVLLVPPIILLAVAALKSSGQVFEGLGLRGRLIVLLISIPLLYCALRACYGLVTQGVRSMFCPHVWWEPLSLAQDTRTLLMDFGPFLLIMGAILLLCLLRPLTLPGRLAKAMVVLTCLVQVAMMGVYVKDVDYTVVTASRQLGERLPPGTVVLGNTAVNLMWDNRIQAIFTYPDINYANRDEEQVKKWNAPYCLAYSKTAMASGQSVHWENFSAIWSKGAHSSVYAPFTRVVQSYALYQTDEAEYTAEGTRGYVVLLDRGE